MVVVRGPVALKRVAAIGKFRSYSPTCTPVFLLFGFFFFAADAPAPALTGVPDRLCSSTSIFTPDSSRVPDRMGVGAAMMPGGGRRPVILSMNERFGASNE
ncbi:hypothetical protein SCHPADRAFT_901447 [Schizopora paradoxa]|uniref:Uncharacterized protein n=1 Tax=Schizopora paradoxa TaxID=27342 RepID=A0A0H2SHG2_9AGAM|nr:hypothetical protein SCHPADRAFT_901447 [Schizopora paradoxa]